jgi:hypothetical protein
MATRPNWRIPTLRQGLEALDLDGDLLRHEIKREVFIAPRAMGSRSYLRGETDSVRWFDLDLERLAAHRRTRWAAPRADRDRSYRGHRRDAMRISPEIAALGNGPAAPPAP